MSLISVKGDTPESEAIKKTLPNYQYIAVRNAQQFTDASIIEKRGDDVLVEQRHSFVVVWSFHLVHLKVGGSECQRQQQQTATA